MENKRYEFILSLDPSGAFDEGKGCTGWVLTDGFGNLMRYGQIDAVEFATAEEYWAKHVELIEEHNEKYKGKLLVLIEDYVLYPHKFNAQTYSKMETSRLIGILQITCYNLYQPYTFQRAVEIKSRWSNDVLIREGLMKYKGKYKGYLIRKKDAWEHVNRHILDAYRHAQHYTHFKNFNNTTKIVTEVRISGYDNYR